MNNSELFKKAHQVAKQTVKAVGDYQIAFTLALRNLIAELKKPEIKYIIDKSSVAVESATWSLFFVLTVAFVATFVTGDLVFTILGAVGCLVGFILGLTVAYGVTSFINFLTVRNWKKTARRVEKGININAYYVWMV